MRKNSIHCFRSRRAFAWAALLALAFHALIPVGYMPDFSGHGHGILPITICDGMDHAHMHHHDGGHTAAGHDTCPFSAGAMYSFGGADVIVLPPAAHASPCAAPPPASAVLTRPGFANASPRSPPFLS